MGDGSTCDTVTEVRPPSAMSGAMQRLRGIVARNSDLTQQVLSVCEPVLRPRELGVEVAQDGPEVCSTPLIGDLDLIGQNVSANNAKLEDMLQYMEL